MGILASILKERRILTNIRLTDHQKEVLVRIFSAPNESIAADEALRGGRSYVQATHTLQNLGFIEFNEDDRVASVTDTGEQVMKDAYLLDDMGELTPDAEEFIEQPEGPAPTEPTEPNQELGGELGTEPGSEFTDLGLESFSLLKQLSANIPAHRATNSFLKS